MDCIEYMMQFPDNYFELAIVDPPYGIKINMNIGRRKNQRKKHEDKNWDNEIPNDNYFNELFRVSQNQIIWGGIFFSLALTKSWIFWDKQLPEGLSFADGELAWTSFDKTLKKVKMKYYGFVGIDVDGRIHPTQKPVLLYRWLLNNYAKPNDKILDTHLGSGSSRIAAYMQGFDFYACELDKDYFDKSCKRFDDYKKQLKLL